MLIKNAERNMVILMYIFARYKKNNKLRIPSAGRIQQKAKRKKKNTRNEQ